MGFACTDQQLFAVAGFWQQTAMGPGFAMVTCDANELVGPNHPTAMITVLQPENHDCRLTGSYEDSAALQRPYTAHQMTVIGPEFPMRQKAASNG